MKGVSGVSDLPRLASPRLALTKGAFPEVSNHCLKIVWASSAHLMLQLFVFLGEIFASTPQCVPPVLCRQFKESPSNLSTALQSAFHLTMAGGENNSKVKFLSYNSDGG